MLVPVKTHDKMPSLTVEILTNYKSSTVQVLIDYNRR